MFDMNYISLTSGIACRPNKAGLADVRSLSLAIGLWSKENVFYLVAETDRGSGLRKISGEATGHFQRSSLLCRSMR